MLTRAYFISRQRQSRPCGLFLCSLWAMAGIALPTWHNDKKLVRRTWSSPYNKSNITHILVGVPNENVPHWADCAQLKYHDGNGNPCHAAGPQGALPRRALYLSLITHAHDERHPRGAQGHGRS